MSGRDQAAEAGPRRVPRWLWPALVVSVAINLLVVGAIAGFALRHGGLGKGFRNGNLIGYMYSSLPRDRRKALRAATAEIRSELRPLRAAARRARRDAAQILAAEPFNKAAYGAAHVRSVEAEMKLRMAAEKLFVELAANMTAKERRGFVEWREKRRRWRRWRRRDRQSDYSDRAQPGPAATEEQPLNPPPK